MTAVSYFSSGEVFSILSGSFHLFRRVFHMQVPQLACRQHHWRLAKGSVPAWVFVVVRRAFTANGSSRKSNDYFVVVMIYS